LGKKVRDSLKKRASKLAGLNAVRDFNLRMRVGDIEGAYVQGRRMGLVLELKEKPLYRTRYGRAGGRWNSY